MRGEVPVALRPYVDVVDLAYTLLKDYREENYDRIGDQVVPNS